MIFDRALPHFRKLAALIALRECAYDRQAPFGKLDKGQLDAAAVNKWTVVDIKTDWRNELPLAIAGQRDAQSHQQVGRGMMPKPSQSRRLISAVAIRETVRCSRRRSDPENGPNWERHAKLAVSLNLRFDSLHSCAHLRGKSVRWRHSEFS
jgi:hypothetical protein